MAVRFGQVRWLAIPVCVLGTSLASCSGGDGTDDLFASTDSAPAATTSVTSAAGTLPSTGPIDLSDSGLSDSELEEALAFYREFLSVQDQSRSGDADASARLSGMASEPVLAELDRLDLAGGSESSLNVVRVSGPPSAAVVADCVEVTAGTGPGPRYIDQEVTLTRDGDAWSVTGLLVNHDGRPGEGFALGCIPAHHGTRVVGSVKALFDGLADDYLAPQAGLSDTVLDLLGDPLRPALQQVFDQQAAQGLYRDTEEESFYEPLGSDPASADSSFVVGVCTRLPEGRYARSVETGEIIEGSQLFRPGDVIYTTAMVTSTRDDDGGFTDKITNFGDLEYPSGCWDRAS